MVAEYGKPIEPLEVEPFICPGCKRRMKLKWNWRYKECFACTLKKKMAEGEYQKRRFKLRD